MEEQLRKDIKEYLLTSQNVRISNLEWVGQPDSACSWITGDLTASDAAGGIFAVQARDRNNFVVDMVIIDVTTASSGACTIDVGVSADAVTSSDTLIDGVSVGSSAVLNNYDDKGTNGRAVRKVTSGQYITASKATGATSGLVGKYYIRYRSTI